LGKSAAAPRKKKKTLPTLIAEYYAAIKDPQNVLHEMGTRPASSRGGRTFW
jgi:hypothetical protein